MMNIGYKPTFHDQERSLTFEAHFFDYEGDLYGQSIEIEFLDFLRPERKFGSAEELISQIHSDAAESRRRLGQKV